MIGRLEVGGLGLEVVEAAEPRFHDLDAEVRLRQEDLRQNYERVKINSSYGDGSSGLALNNGLRVVEFESNFHLLGLKGLRSSSAPRPRTN